jgi:hypothetical protein
MGEFGLHELPWMEVGQSRSKELKKVEFSGILGIKKENG